MNTDQAIDLGALLARAAGHYLALAAMILLGAFSTVASPFIVVAIFGVSMIVAISLIFAL